MKEDKRVEQDFLLRREHNEFAKRMEAEHDRQNHRLGDLEESVKQIGALTVAVEKMAVTMQQMLNEQKAQGERMEVLESRDGEMWRKAIGYIVTAVLGLVIGYAFKQIGM